MGQDASTLAAGGPAQRIQLTTPQDGRVRSYLLYAPAADQGGALASPPPAAGRALVVALHGGGGMAVRVDAQTGWAAKAAAEGFVLAVPDATARDPSKPARFLGNPQTWVDGSDRNAGRAGVDDAAFIGAVLDDVATRTPIDPQRVYLTGFSNGAAMTFAAAARLAGRFAAIAPVGGACWLARALELPQGVPTLYIVGAADTLVPVAGGPMRLASGRPLDAHGRGGSQDNPTLAESLRRWRAVVGASEAPVTGAYPDPPLPPYLPTAKPGVHVTWFPPATADGAGVACVLLDGHGHVWPGGRAMLPAFTVGIDSGALNATDVIWSFFQAHRRHAY